MIFPCCFFLFSLMAAQTTVKGLKAASLLESTTMYVFLFSWECLLCWGPRQEGVFPIRSRAGSEILSAAHRNGRTRVQEQQNGDARWRLGKRKAERTRCAKCLRGRHFVTPKGGLLGLHMKHSCKVIRIWMSENDTLGHMIGRQLFYTQRGKNSESLVTGSLRHDLSQTWATQCTKERILNQASSFSLYTFPDPFPGTPQHRVITA